MRENRVKRLLAQGEIPIGHMVVEFLDSWNSQDARSGQSRLCDL